MIKDMFGYPFFSRGNMIKKKCMFPFQRLFFFRKPEKKEAFLALKLDNLDTFLLSYFLY